MLNMSTLSTNDHGKTFWELVYGSVNQVLANHRRWHQLWRSPFPVTLQRIFNNRLKKLSLVVFCCNCWTLQQKPHDYICSGCKNMVSQKCGVFIGPSCKYMQYGCSVRLQHQLQLNIRPTIHEDFLGNVSSGKMTTWETSFRESDHPGIVFSGKKTIRESNNPGNDRIPFLCTNVNKHGAGIRCGIRPNEQC